MNKRKLLIGTSAVLLSYLSTTLNPNYVEASPIPELRESNKARPSSFLIKPSNTKIIKKQHSTLIPSVNITKSKNIPLEENLESKPDSLLDLLVYTVKSIYSVLPIAVIDKSENSFEFYSLAGFFSFPLKHGKEIGDKLRANDEKTPVGLYQVCDIRTSMHNYLFIQLNYPNNDDAEFGYKTKVIDFLEYKAILSANKKGICPPKNTGLGGDIGIHSRRFYKDDNNKLRYVELDYKSPFTPIKEYTKGCIAIKIPDIEKLKAVGFKGMNVLIKE